ncbi:hypothetical protein [Psychromicrobium lacuslunae]|uniref:DUF559 domain-containing protein n=1 Tax=Psychromicrobium lacuslunae TaxID=1618207 RepID=A0A0D4C003_9MICC|nr:hypothetical protein [Psychromicrobium lacuslunae]AJT41904.1 hypothetical protein UM93_10955 [Psychromicrobium lacuslunae]
MESRIQELAELHGGAVRRAELRRAGISDWSMRQAVAAGVVWHFPGGVYACPDAPSWWVRARLAGADLGCVSAAMKARLWVLNPPRQMHVTASNNRVRGPFIQHRSYAKTALLDSVLQCLRCLPELDALVIAESSVALGKLSLQQLRLAAKGPRNGNLRRIIAKINPAAESLLETIARYLLENAGYQVQIQKYLPGLGRLDLLVDGVLGIEVDGREYHSSAEAFSEDRRRSNFYVVHGIPTLRVTYHLLVHQPEEFLRLVQIAILNCRR